MVCFQIYRFKRISGNKKDFDSDPCLMEVLVVSYVLSIRKEVGEGKWPFHNPYDSEKPPSKSYLFFNYGVMARQGTFGLNSSFESFVKKCLDNDNVLLKAISDAVSISPRPVRTSKKAPAKEKKDTFLTSEGEEIVVDNELLTRFFTDKPSRLAEYSGLVEVTPTAMFNKGEPVATALADELYPHFLVLLKEREEKGGKPESRGQKRKSVGNEKTGESTISPKKQRRNAPSPDSTETQRKAGSGPRIRYTQQSQPDQRLNLEASNADGAHDYDVGSDKESTESDEVSLFVFFSKFFTLKYLTISIISGQHR